MILFLHIRLSLPSGSEQHVSQPPYPSVASRAALQPGCTSHQGLSFGFLLPSKPHPSHVMPLRVWSTVRGRHSHPPVVFCAERPHTAYATGERDRGARQLAARIVRQHVLGSVARWQHAAGRRRRRKQRDIDRDRPQATGHKPQATDHVTCRHSDNADKGTTERPRRLYKQTEIREKMGGIGGVYDVPVHEQRSPRPAPGPAGSHTRTGAAPCRAGQPSLVTIKRVRAIPG